MYNNKIKLQSLLKERSLLLLHEATHGLEKDSYRRYALTREYQLRLKAIDKMTLPELRGNTLYCDAPYLTEEYDEYLELMETISRGSFNESFFHNQHELHRREYEKYEYLHLLICAIPEIALARSGEEYTILLRDPFDQKPFSVRKDIFSTDMLSVPHLIEIGITSTPNFMDKIYRLKPLSEVLEERKKHPIGLSKAKDH